MKALTVFLCLLLSIVIAFGAWFMITGTLDAQVSRVTAQASEYPEAFDSIRGVLTGGGAQAIYSTGDPLENPADYTLMDVNIQLTNRSLFDAEWLNIELTPISGDVALYSLTGQCADVPAKGMQSVNLKLVTRAGADSVHTAKIQYYVFGVSRSIQVQF